MNIIFDPPPGINPDDTSLSADGRWATGVNVRFRNGRPEVIGGWTTRSFTGSWSGTPRKIIEWVASNGTAYVAYGTTTKLFVETGGAIYDITPTGVTSVSQWTLHTWGDTLLASPRGGALYQWSNNTGVIAAKITQAPANITCFVVTPERQVVATGCNEVVSTTFNGRCVRGCDFEDLTNWTPTTTNNSFEDILDAVGLIVTSRNIGAAIGIWTNNQLFYAEFIGDPSQTYRYTKAGSDCGCFGLDSVTIANEAAYWITHELLIYVWAPGAVPQPLKCSLIETFQNSIRAFKTSATVLTFCFHNARFNELWIFYPASSNATFATRYIAVNLSDGIWFKGTLSRTAMYQGPLNLIGTRVNAAGAPALTLTFNHESGNKGTSDDPLSWSLTSGDFHLKGAQSLVMVRGMLPDIQGQLGDVLLTILARDRPQGATSQQTSTLTTSTTKADLRINGRLLTVGFSGNDATGASDTFMRLGTPIFDAVELGQRW